MTTKKVCRGCERLLPLDAFSPHKAGVLGRHSRCKECRREEAKERLAAQGEHVRAVKAAYARRVRALPRLTTEQLAAELRRRATWPSAL